MKQDTLELRKRFVSDLKLPIQIINNDEIFEYFLDLYENTHSSRTKFEELNTLIEKRFNNNTSLFLNHYYEVRNKIIEDILNREEYKTFNSMDMNKFKLEKNNLSSSNIYKETNHNRKFISIDLKKANFNALKFVDPNILGIESDYTYEEFINKYTDLDYIANSKYTRQVIFGKLNPSRHITVEKYLINECRKYIQDNYTELSNVVSFCSDEIVFDITELNNIDEHKLNNIVNYLEKQYNISLKIDIFVLLKHAFYTAQDNCKIVVYQKYHDGDEYIIPIGCPVFYYAQIFKYLNNIILEDKDLYFMHESQLSKFIFNLKYE
ncbi:MAG: hypothetical protein RSE41_02935 [Clostridia bacterium]